MRYTTDSRQAVQCSPIACHSWENVKVELCTGAGSSVDQAFVNRFSGDCDGQIHSERDAIDTLMVIKEV